MMFGMSLTLRAAICQFRKIHMIVNQRNPGSIKTALLLIQLKDPAEVQIWTYMKESEE